MRPLTLGFSPCPNDTFIFHALVHGLLPGCPYRFVPRLEDVETLNSLARDAILDLTKASYHAIGHLRRDYWLLRSGGALGRGCGPLLVARQALSMEQLRGKRIAIPGRLTTANLLLQLRDEGLGQTVELPFHRIMPAVAAGEVDAGVIIHESRFTYPAHGLQLVEDLGAWWERDTGLPIPLGGILARRDLGRERALQLEGWLRASVDYALAHPQASRDYIRQHAQELNDEVTASHIRLYVNGFSSDLGEEGLTAVRYLLTRAEERGLIPPCDLELTPSGC